MLASFTARATAPRSKGTPQRCSTRTSRQRDSNCAASREKVVRLDDLTIDEARARLMKALAALAEATPG